MPHTGDERIIDYVGANVLRLRKRLGLTQEQMAERLGMNARYLRRIEAADVNVSVVQLARIARVLDVPPGLLIRKTKSFDRAPGRPRGKSRE